MTGKEDDLDRAASLAAGEFAVWLRGTEALLQAGEGTADVPCGACRGCCRSSMFIHIRPEEKETLSRIPRALLFPAPGLPKGHVLMGYDAKGECPMFRENACSIYEARPQTCRNYDCRIFAATGIAVDPTAQPEIARRVREWAFTYDEVSRGEHGKVREAAEFLAGNRELFPTGSLPSYPVQLAALAVSIYRLFGELREKSGAEASPGSEAATAERILVALRDAAQPMSREATA
jgi:Fe-S-cluster containining protein